MKQNTNIFLAGVLWQSVAGAPRFRGEVDRAPPLLWYSMNAGSRAALWVLAAALLVCLCDIMICIFFNMSNMDFGNYKKIITNCFWSCAMMFWLLRQKAAMTEDFSVFCYLFRGSHSTNTFPYIERGDEVRLWWHGEGWTEHIGR